MTHKLSRRGSGRPQSPAWAFVLVGYYPLARIASLMPWNREDPLSGRAVAVTFFSAPVQGSVQNRLHQAG